MLNHDLLPKCDLLYLHPWDYFNSVLKVETKAIVTRLLTTFFSMVVVCVNHVANFYFGNQIMKN
jgi:hypothetical protein